MEATMHEAKNPTPPNPSRVRLPAKRPAAQALLERLTPMSADTVFDELCVSRLWQAESERLFPVQLPPKSGNFGVKNMALFRFQN